MANSCSDVVEVVRMPPSVGRGFNVFVNVCGYADWMCCMCSMGIVGLCLGLNLVLSL